MPIATRHLSILSLIMSAAALTLALAVFFGADPIAGNSAAILLPTRTLAKTINQPSTHDADATLAYWTSSLRDAYTTYTHPITGLTVKYPSDFDLYAGEEKGGDIIVGEKPEYGMAFQIFIQPFDESGPITVDRIRRDLPDLPMEAVAETELMHTGDPVLIFLSVDDSLGRIPEAWFVRNGYLFQLTMYAPPDDDGDPLRVVWFRSFLRDLTFTP